MMREHRIVAITGDVLSIKEIQEFITDTQTVVVLSQGTLERMRRTRDILLKAATKRPIYGVNTGFGPMVRHIIGKNQITALQYNLLRGHAMGIGEPVKDEYVLAAMIVRLNTLVKGHSAVSKELVSVLAQCINDRVIPIVPEHGAVGTSGDLVQLAHIALTLIGEGNVHYQGKAYPSSEVLKKLGIRPHALGPKEGLSLINGTSMMTGIAALLIVDSKRVVSLATRTGALAFELVRGFEDVIDPALHAARPHRGQGKIAQALRELVKGSKLIRDREDVTRHVLVNDATHVTDTLLQEVYSIRCIPQILGPIYDIVSRVSEIVETEMNSVTDNPIVDAKTGRFLHGGNFHGDYIASSVDQLKIGFIKLTLLTERRINFFYNRNTNQTFPEFLNLKTPGLTMGLQGLQFVATSTAAQSQSLGYPHSLHSIPTNGDNQDVVSMGTDAALIASKVMDNAFTLLAIELVSLSQAAAASNAENKLSSASRRLVEMTRRFVPLVQQDRPLTADIERLKEWIAHDETLDIAW